MSTALYHGMIRLFSAAHDPQGAAEWLARMQSDTNPDVALSADSYGFVISAFATHGGEDGPCG